MKKMRRGRRRRTAGKALDCTEIIGGGLDDRYEIAPPKEGAEVPVSPLWRFEKLAFDELCRRLEIGDFGGCHEIIGLLTAASLI